MTEHKRQAGDPGAVTIAPDVEVTEEMIEAGEEAILSRLGGCSDLGGHFSASDLAIAVYRAMECVRES